MPRQTFFNLPQEKRDHITRAAISHFVRHGYKHASITAIVAEAGIAKGSFYQYFLDKDDLYGYLIRLMAEWKMAVYRQEFHSLEQLSITEYMRRVSHIQLREFEKTPDMMRLGLDFVRSLHEPYAQKIYRDLSGVIRDFLIDAIEAEKQRGELDPRVDSRLLNLMLLSLGNYLTEWMVAHGLEEITPAFVDSLIDKLEYILTHGIYRGHREG